MNPMLRHVVRRILLVIPALFGISVVIFLMCRLLPGDIVDFLSGGDTQITPEQRHQMREQLGLTGSYFEQYWRWIKGLLTGDMGNSLVSTIPVSHTLANALPITFELIGLGIVIALLFGIPFGVISAVHRDSASDYASRVGGLVGVSIPNFWLATLLLILTSRVFHWVPPISYVDPTVNLGQNLQQFILPAISISVFTLAIVMRMVRATMLEVLGLDYVRTARAKGLPRRRVVYRHALRNALIPVITIAGFEVGVLMSGAAIVEQIFGLPGLGYTLIQAITTRDYPVIQATTMVIATVFVVMNLLVDLLYTVLDPRISVD